MNEQDRARSLEMALGEIEKGPRQRVDFAVGTTRTPLSR